MHHTTTETSTAARHPEHEHPPQVAADVLIGHGDIGKAVKEAGIRIDGCTSGAAYAST